VVFCLEFYLGVCFVNYITAVMCAENCLHFLNLAETYGLSDCVHETKSFVLRDFAALSRNSAGFRNISCDLLCELLSNDRLHTASELSVFNVAVSWLEALATRQDPETIRRVLGLVRYGLMSAKQMEGIVTNPLLAGEACHEVLQVSSANIILLLYYIILYNIIYITFLAGI